MIFSHWKLGFSWENFFYTKSNLFRIFFETSFVYCKISFPAQKPFEWSLNCFNKFFTRVNMALGLKSIFYEQKKFHGWKRGLGPYIQLYDWKFIHDLWYMSLFNIHFTLVSPIDDRTLYSLYSFVETKSYIWFLWMFETLFTTGQQNIYI